MNNRQIKCLTKLLVAGCVLSGVPAWSESASSKSDGKDAAKNCVYGAAKSIDVRFVAYLVDQSAVDYVKKWKKGIANYSILQDYYSNTTTVVKPLSFVLLWGRRWIKIDTPDENRNALMYFQNATAQPTMVMAKATQTEKGLVNVSVVADLNNQVLRRTTFHERYPYALQRGPELVPSKRSVNLRLEGLKKVPANPQIFNYGDQFYQPSKQEK